MVRAVAEQIARGVVGVAVDAIVVAIEGGQETAGVLLPTIAVAVIDLWPTRLGSFPPSLGR